MPMHNLIEYKDTYLKKSEGWWRYYKDNPGDVIVNSKSFKYQIAIAEIALLMVVQRMLK